MKIISRENGSMNGNIIKADPSKEQYFINAYFEMWIQDGIFFINVLTDTFTLEIAKESVKQRIERMNGECLPMLSDSRKVIKFEKEARHYLADAQSIKYLNAGAILVENQLQKVLGNFFLLINKPKVPAKLFTSRIEALEWLVQFKSKR